MEFYLIRLSISLLLVCHLNNVNASSIWNAKTFIQSNCTLSPEKKSQQLSLENFIERENRLIKLDIHLNWTFGLPNSTYLKKASWFMTTDHTGKRLLLLDDNYVSMSLGTLSYDTEHLDISLIQEPADCLRNFTADDIHQIVVFSLLTLPTDSKSINENDISILHICTDSVNKYGTCCNLTLDGETVTCDPLSQERIYNFIRWIILIVTFTFISHSPYFIPNSFNTGRSISSFHVAQTLIAEDDNEFTAPGKSIEDNVNEFSAPDKSIEDCVNEFTAPGKSMEDCLLVSELHFSKGLFLNLYKTMNDVFCRCIIKDYDIFMECCSGKPCDGRECFKYLRCFAVAVFFSLIGGLTILPFFYDRSRHNILEYFPVYIAPLILLLCAFIEYSTGSDFKIETHNSNLKTIYREVLRNRFKAKVTKCLTLMFVPFRYCDIIFCSYLCLLLTIPLSLLYFCLKSFPLFDIVLKFILYWYSEINKNCRDYQRLKILIVLFLQTKIFGLILLCLIIFEITLLILLVITYSVTFYTKCMAYVLIGLFLNYDQILDELILIFFVLYYVLDCLNGVYSKINTFNKSIFTLIEEDYKDIIERMFDYSLVIRDNVAFKILTRNNRNNSNNAKGLYLFYKYDEYEDTAYLHIPEKFLEQMSSSYSQIVPGHMFVLLYKALREICCLILLVYVAYRIVNEFSRNSEVSSSVHTMVTLGTSTLLTIVNKIIFRTKLASGKEYHIQLKSLLDKHLESHEPDYWIDETDTHTHVDNVQQEGSYHGYGSL